MTIEKKIAYKEGVEKIKFLADLKARFEKAKEGGFKGNIREFILKEKYKDILGEAGYAKGGPTNKPNGLTTISLDDWLEGIDPGGWASEEDKPIKKASLGDVEQELADEYWQEQYNQYLDGGGLFMDFKDFMKWQLSQTGGGGILSVI